MPEPINAKVPERSCLAVTGATGGGVLERDRDLRGNSPKLIGSTNNFLGAVLLCFKSNKQTS